jgi:putative membrane protein
MPLELSDDDVAAIEARIRAFETRTGAEAVAAVVDRSDHYHGLRWRAFALGIALAALAVIVAELMRPDWIHAHAVLFAVASVLIGGLACALLATAWPAFERLFLQRVRAEAETLQRAKTLFLARELFATPSRNGVLLFASRFERAAVIYGDRGYEGRVSPDEWQRVVDAMTAPFRQGDTRGAFTAGLDALEALLVAKGFRGDGKVRNALPDRPFEPNVDER